MKVEDDLGVRRLRATRVEAFVRNDAHLCVCVRVCDARLLLICAHIHMFVYMHACVYIHRRNDA